MTIRIVVDEVKASIHAEEIVHPEFDVPNTCLPLQRDRGSVSGGGYVNSNGMEPRLRCDYDHIMTLVDSVAP